MKKSADGSHGIHTTCDGYRVPGSNQAQDPVNLEGRCARGEGP